MELAGGEATTGLGAVGPAFCGGFDSIWLPRAPENSHVALLPLSPRGSFAFQIPYIETSAKDPPLNVDKAFHDLVRVIR